MKGCSRCRAMRFEELRNRRATRPVRLAFERALVPLLSLRVVRLLMVQCMFAVSVYWWMEHRSQMYLSPAVWS